MSYQRKSCLSLMEERFWDGREVNTFRNFNSASIQVCYDYIELERKQSITINKMYLLSSNVTCSSLIKKRTHVKDSLVCE